MRAEGRRPPWIPMVLVVLLVVIPLNIVQWRKLLWKQPVAITIRTNGNHTTFASVSMGHEHFTVIIPIVIQLSGELGNHLSKLASGIALALELEAMNQHAPSWMARAVPNASKVQIKADILLRHQDRTTKWEKSVHVLEECFPTLVTALQSPTLRVPTYRANQTSSVLNVSEASHYTRPSPDPFEGVNSLDANVVTQTLHNAVRDAMAAALNDTRIVRNETIHGTAPSTIYYHAPHVSPPLFSDHLSHWDYRLDRYHAVNQNLMALSSTCCASLPDKDEVVFYWRGFTTELPRNGVAKGFEELLPHTLVRVLDGYYPQSNVSFSGTMEAPRKIALLSRFANRHEVMEPYVQNLTHHGWTVRVIANQTMAQDFCFMKSTSYHLMGVARSTFLQWSALIGEPNTTERNMTRRRVTLYSMDSPARREWAKQYNRSVLEWYNFTYSDLQWEFPLLTND